jgi:hypothetical protein
MEKVDATYTTEQLASQLWEAQEFCKDGPSCHGIENCWDISSTDGTTQRPKSTFSWAPLRIPVHNTIWSGRITRRVENPVIATLMVIPFSLSRRSWWEWGTAEQRRMPRQNAPCDKLLFWHQRKNQAKLQKAQFEANAPSPGDHALGLLDEEEEKEQSMAGIA